MFGNLAKCICGAHSVLNVVNITLSRSIMYSNVGSNVQKVSTFFPKYLTSDFTITFNVED